MVHRPRIVSPALIGLAVAVAATGLATPALADPAPPTPTYPIPAPAPPTPASTAAPVAAEPIPGDPTAPPPPRDPFTPYVPEIPNPSYGSGKSGGGVFGTLKDLWQQVQNPTLAPGDVAGPGVPRAQPSISAPVPVLPPGYVSINLPGSEAPAGSEAASSGPALPPGYYPLDGPPPPGYEFLVPSGGVPPAAATPAPIAPVD